KFALNSPHARLDLAGNLANEESFVGRTIQKRQNSTSGLAKEQIPNGRERCSHSENNCTQNEYRLASGAHFLDKHPTAQRKLGSRFRFQFPGRRPRGQRVPPCVRSGFSFLGRQPSAASLLGFRQSATG